MLLTITHHGPQATDLGYLLHKHPERVQQFRLPFGVAHVFYPQTDEDRCTAALLVEVDPVGLVRRGPRGGFALAEYVNDRPYVASSMLSVALVSVLKSAMAGRCDAKPGLADTPLALTAELPVVAASGGEELARRLLEQLGYRVSCQTIALDPRHPDWGDSRYLQLRLDATVRLADLLTHLYVLLPVLDDDKHYWVSDDEIDKLMARGEGWLPGHPERELITRRYLKHQSRLVAPAVEQLDALAAIDAAASADPDALDAEEQAAEEQGPQPLRLRDQRLDAVEAELLASGAKRVLDLGCGPGALLLRLQRRGFDEIVGVDVSVASLEKAAKRLKLDERSDEQRERLRLLHSALTYRDSRLAGYDAAVLVEVIEHLDLPRLRALEHNVFGAARPSTVIVTTPNREYNVRWPSLPGGRFRHRDHRFEWTREEFAHWATDVGRTFGYAARVEPIGPVDDEVGSPTQMAVLTR